MQFTATHEQHKTRVDLHQAPSDGDHIWQVWGKHYLSKNFMKWFISKYSSLVFSWKALC